MKCFYQPEPATNKIPLFAIKGELREDIMPIKE